MTTMKAGPGCVCQPVEPPGLMVVVRTTVSVGCLEEILKPCEFPWNGPRLIRPSVVLVRFEGGVACATPASASEPGSGKPAMLRMRFMYVYPISAAVSRSAPALRHTVDVGSSRGRRVSFHMPLRISYPGRLYLDYSPVGVVDLRYGQAEPVPQVPEPFAAGPGDRLLQLVLVDTIGGAGGLARRGGHVRCGRVAWAL